MRSRPEEDLDHPRPAFASFPSDRRDFGVYALQEGFQREGKCSKMNLQFIIILQGASRPVKRILSFRAPRRKKKRPLKGRFPLLSVPPRSDDGSVIRALPSPLSFSSFSSSPLRPLPSCPGVQGVSFRPPFPPCEPAFFFWPLLPPVSPLPPPLSLSSLFSPSSSSPPRGDTRGSPVRIRRLPDTPSSRSGCILLPLPRTVPRGRRRASPCSPCR